jgi:hypothetical protein
MGKNAADSLGKVTDAMREALQREAERSAAAAKETARILIEKAQQR